MVFFSRPFSAKFTGLRRGLAEGGDSDSGISAFRFRAAGSRVTGRLRLLGLWVRSIGVGVVG